MEIVLTVLFCFAYFVVKICLHVTLKYSYTCTCFVFVSIHKSDLIKKTIVIHTHKNDCYIDLFSLEIRVEFYVVVVKI